MDSNENTQGQAPAPKQIELPVLNLPPRVPVQRYRPAQSNIPDARQERDRLKLEATRYVEKNRIVPPLPLEELLEHAGHVRGEIGTDARYDHYLAILVNNAAWRDGLAQIPYERRLLLIPKCLRVEEHCPAPFDEFGLLCKECGLCSIQDLTKEAERLGYAVLVAEGSAIVTSMIETGRIEAIVGVSCINVLEKCFPHLEASAVPGAAIPLLQDDCVNTTVDLDWVWDLIHLTSDDQTYRLDLDGMKHEVQSWFAPSALDRILGEATDETERIAREWLSREGKRWRPYLATCVYVALTQDGEADEPELSDDVRRLAVAIECFHKASLIHDDIEDGDGQRYGAPTLHVEHGEAIALNVGDFLLGEGYRLLSELDVPAERRVQMLRTAAAGHVTLTRGQGAELALARSPRVLSSTEVLQIFRQKTSPAFEVALGLAAQYAGADEGTRGVLDEYSEALGIAYQIRDDLEDFDGSSGDSNDLRDLRPSLLLTIASKRAADDEVRELFEGLMERRLPYAEVAEEVRRQLEELGALDKARELLNAYQEQAVRSLRFLENATLKGLLRRVIHKIFPQVLIEGYCGEFEAKNAEAHQAPS